MLTKLLRFFWKHDVTPFLHSRFVVKHIIESVSLYAVASKVAQVMVAELTVHAVANVVELFV